MTIASADPMRTLTSFLALGGGVAQQGGAALAHSIPDRHAGCPSAAPEVDAITWAASR
jgi:hypothetical protein